MKELNLRTPSALAVGVCQSLMDTHAHLTSPQLFPNLAAILQRAQDAGVNKIINICTDIPTLEKGLALRAKQPLVYNAAAITPHDASEKREPFFKIIKKQVHRLIAVGETGLDYYYLNAPKETQKSFFKRHLRLAIDAELPVIIHCREAFSDLFAILDAEYKDKPALLHCFTGTLQEAKMALQRGLYISFSGIITFKNSANLKAIAKFIPLERLLIETDSPYLAPHPKRGTANEPANLPFIAETIAAIRDLSTQQIVCVLKENGKRFFGV